MYLCSCGYSEDSPLVMVNGEPVDGGYDAWMSDDGIEVEGPVTIELCCSMCGSELRSEHADAWDRKHSCW